MRMFICFALSIAPCTTWFASARVSAMMMASGSVRMPRSALPRVRSIHSNYSFRRMAQDQVDVMEKLGFPRFMVAGHDRGARTAVRMALDHPAAVQKLCAIDILPTHHVWTHVTRQWALNSYHW